MSDKNYVDVLIVGAGLSGIGMACYLKKLQPTKSFALLEARAATGGTWDFFRYPGIRSDSDLHTFGYEFKPWLDKKAIARGPAILAYLRETAQEHQLEQAIRLNHKVESASFDSGAALWTVNVLRIDTQERFQMRSRWLISAAGYYRYDGGHMPEFAGMESFQGRIVHPQSWPQDLDYAGRKMVVVGSGATSITLVPALAEKAAHVTMLQRTPTYVMGLPSEDHIANWLNKWLPTSTAYALTRRKNMALARMIWNYCRKHPDKARARIRKFNARALPEGYPVDEHFNPPYNPWDQRLCLAPDGDFFKAIRKGKAEIVTDQIERFTADGVLLRSGKTVQADIVVTATGMNLLPFGGMQLQVDGVPVDLSNSVAFKGMMLSGIPNFGIIIGYTNASWTLKVGPLCEHFCRVLDYMDRHDQQICVPRLPSPDMPTRPLLDFGAGYVQRSLSALPRQGMRHPWLMSMDYREDIKVLRHGPVEDECLHFSKATQGVAEAFSDEDQFCDLPSGIRLCYRVQGDANATPLILVAGLGLQLQSWPAMLIQRLVDSGYRVITLDNRDVGRSSRATFRPMRSSDLLRSRFRDEAYAVEDMAKDVLGLMAHLHIETAHVVGMSMGGMIGQSMASMAPEKLLSLTSIFSTTGARSVGQPAFSTKLRLMKKSPRNRQEYIDNFASMMRHIGPPTFDRYEAKVRAQTGNSWDRGDGARAHHGVLRQIEAIMKSGDRTKALQKISTPTLVIHGDKDLMVHPSGGAATAKAIQGSTFVQLEGMGHFIPEHLVPKLVELIDGLARRSGHGGRLQEEQQA